MRLALAPLALALALLAGCGGSGAPTSTPVASNANRSLYALVQHHYLWLDTLPGRVDPDAHGTPEDLLRHLTAEARRQDKDRWSFIQKRTDAGAATLYNPHSSFEVRFGMVVLNRDGCLQVAEVLPGSGAERAGIGRGDRVLAVALSRAGLEAPLDPISTQAVLGTEVPPGTTVHMRLAKASGAGPVDTAVSASLVSLDLVPQAGRPVVFEEGGAGSATSSSGPSRPRPSPSCARSAPACASAA